VIGEAPRLAFVVGQFKVNRFLHTHGNRTAMITDSDDLLPKAGNQLPDGVLCSAGAGLCLRLDCRV